MIQIVQGASNSIVLTLTENVTINNPYYLMVLDGRVNEAQIKLFITDTSSYPEHYNLFVLIEGTDITIPFKGDYKYRVFEKEVNTNEDIPSDSYLLQTGLLRVTSTDEITQYEHTTIFDTKVYESY